MINCSINPEYETEFPKNIIIKKKPDAEIILQI